MTYMQKKYTVRCRNMFFVALLAMIVQFSTIGAKQVFDCNSFSAVSMYMSALALVLTVIGGIFYVQSLKAREQRSVLRTAAFVGNYLIFLVSAAAILLNLGLFGCD